MPDQNTKRTRCLVKLNYIEIRSTNHSNSFSSVVTVTSKATKSSDGIHRLLVNAKHALTIDLPLLLCHEMSKGVFIRGNDFGPSVVAKDN